MNLYQYISPLSNHPPSMIKGIIYSLLRTYMLQNTYEEDYQDVAVKLCTRHVARGWDRTFIRKIILGADKLLRKYPPQLPNLQPAPTKQADSFKDRLFVRMKYSSNNLPRRSVRAVVDRTLGELLEEIGITQVTTAYSQANNIKYLVTNAKLHQPPGKEAIKYYSGELTTTWW